MKKFLAFVMAIIMVAALMAGCGNGSATPAEATSAATAPGSTVSEPTAEPAREVKLSYLTWNYSDLTKSTDAWIKDLKDKFNITLEMQNIPTEQYPTTLKTKMASGDPSDLIMTHGMAKDYTLTSEKITLTKDTFLDISGLKSIADYVPEIVESRKIDGKLFYMPISTNVLGVIYNKKAFSDNGINVPTNMDEFIAACDKLQAAKIIPIAGGFKDAWTTQIIPFIAFGQYINAKDPTIADKLGDLSLKYADIKPDVLKVLGVQQSWAAKGYFPDNFLGSDINVASAMVGTGKAAMLINGTWEYKAVQDADPNAEIGWFLLPLNAAGEKVVAPGAGSANEGMCIIAASKSADAAKNALDYYLSAENQNRVMLDMNGVSTNTKVKVEGVPFLNDVTNSLSSAIKQKNWWGVGADGQYSPSTSAFDLGKEFQALLAKGTTEERFISDFDKANAKAAAKK